jgi:hypothetical protein
LPGAGRVAFSATEADGRVAAGLQRDAELVADEVDALGGRQTDPLELLGVRVGSPKRSTLPLWRLSRIGPMNFVFIAAEKLAVSAM